MFYLLFLIGAEFLFIIVSYYSEIGYLAFLPATVYSVLAVADINSKNKNLSWLVVLVTLGIAIPRLMIQYHNIETKNIKILVENKTRSVPLPPEYKPIIQDCKDPSLTQEYQLRACINNNRIENAKKYKSDQERHNAEASLFGEIGKLENEKINIPLHDYGLFFLYICLSVSMPMAVLILLYPTDGFGFHHSTSKTKRQNQVKTEPQEEKPVSRTTEWRRKKQMEATDGLF